MLMPRLQGKQKVNLNFKVDMASRRRGAKQIKVDSPLGWGLVPYVTVSQIHQHHDSLLFSTTQNSSTFFIFDFWIISTRSFGQTHSFTRTFKSIPRPTLFTTPQIH